MEDDIKEKYRTDINPCRGETMKLAGRDDGSSHFSRLRQWGNIMFVII